MHVCRTTEGWPPGRYDAAVSAALRRRLAAHTGPHDDAPVEDADLPDRLAAYLAERVLDRLRAVRTAEERHALLRRVLDELDADDDHVEEPARVLRAVAQAPGGQSSAERRSSAAIPRSALASASTKASAARRSHVTERRSGSTTRSSSTPCRW